MNAGRCALVIGLVAISASCTQSKSAPTDAAVDAAAPTTTTRTTEGLGERAPRASASTAPSLGYDPLPLPPRDAGPPPPVASWVWKPYKGDGFVASFPGDPKVTELPAEDDKIGFTEAKLDVPGGQASFAVGYSDQSTADVAKPDAFLDEHVTRTPRRGTTDVLHKRAVTLPGGHPGRVVILRRNISGTPLKVYSRIYLVGRRLYTLIVSTLESGGIGEDVVKRFMDSFVLAARP